METACPRFCCCVRYCVDAKFIADKEASRREGTQGEQSCLTREAPGVVVVVHFEIAERRVSTLH